MKNKDRLIKSVISATLIIATTPAFTGPSPLANNPDMEKCYGVVKAGMNDCQTAKASCAGSSTKDNQPNAFIFVPKGSCDKIVGGSTKPLSEVKEQ